MVIHLYMYVTEGRRKPVEPGHHECLNLRVSVPSSVKPQNRKLPGSAYNLGQVYFAPFEVSDGLQAEKSRDRHPGLSQAES